MPTTLAKATAALEAIAPLALAEPWDNVGLLVAPSRRRPVARVLLAIDATAAVVTEAVVRRADLLVAYHPPLFEGLKRLRSDHAEEGRIVRLLEAGIAVYAPHTALDAAPGGVAEWLAEGLGGGASEPLGGGPDRPGPARIRRLARPASLEALLRRVKKHLSLARVRVAASEAHREEGNVLATAAVCPGSGGAVLKAAPAELLVTGEMRHHDVLAANARGASVILCDHTNTERGYLPVLAARLRAALGAGVDVALARADREPLEVV